MKMLKVLLLVGPFLVPLMAGIVWKSTHSNNNGAGHNITLVVEKDSVLRVLFVQAKDLLTGLVKSTNPDKNGSATYEYIYTGEAYYSIDLGKIDFDKEGNAIVPMPMIYDNDLSITSWEKYDVKNNNIASEAVEKLSDDRQSVARQQFREHAEQAKFKELAQEQTEKVIHEMIGKDKKVIFVAEDKTEK
jgi:hypothetical protein